MARTVIVLKHCDFCLLDDPPVKVEATVTEAILLGRMREAREVDVCEDHDAAILAPLRAALSIHGKPAQEPSPAAPAPLTVKGRPRKPMGSPPWKMDSDARECPICGHARARTGQGLTYHMVSIHAIRATEFYGASCPLCERDFTSYGNLAVHVVRTHKMPVTQAFKEAETAGDPRGIVKAARERGERAALVTGTDQLQPA